MRFTCKVKCLFIHFQRTVFWVKALTDTLIKFWIKNPQETPAILTFIFSKIFASPKFFSRNVLIEKYSQNFERDLLRTKELYKSYGKTFDPKIQGSYKKMGEILSNKTQILYFLIRKLKPAIAVETGVAAGNSSGYILQAMKDNRKGKLYSIDLPFQWYIYGDRKLHLDSLPSGKAPGYLIPTHLKKRWNLILGNTYIHLPILLRRLRKIDIFLHDSEHTNQTMMFEYNTSWPIIRKGGILISDDISYTKAFNDFLKREKCKKIIFEDLGVLLKN